MSRLLHRCCRQASTSARLLRKNEFEEATVGQYITTPMGEGDVEGSRTHLSSMAAELGEARRMCVVAFNQLGFRLQQGQFLFGPITVFPKFALSWRVLRPENITDESLEFFTLLEPKLDLLIIGVGDKHHLDKTRRRIHPYLKNHRIKHEILTTEDAIGVFNIVNHEERYAAAALYPPDIVKIGRRDVFALHNMIGHDFMDTVHTHGNIFLGEEPDRRISVYDRIKRGDLKKQMMMGDASALGVEEHRSVLDDIATVAEPRYGSVLKETRAKERLAQEEKMRLKGQPPPKEGDKE